MPVGPRRRGSGISAALSLEVPTVTDTIPIARVRHSVSSPYPETVLFPPQTSCAGTGLSVGVRGPPSMAVGAVWVDTSDPDAINLAAQVRVPGDREELRDLGIALLVVSLLGVGVAAVALAVAA